MTRLVVIAVGGACGAVLRFQVGKFINSLRPSDFPWGTFCINLIGSLLLGYLAGEMGTVWLKSDNLGLTLGTGLLGGFTTFSTYCFEGLKLFQLDKYFLGAAYLFLSVILGIIMAYSGYFIGTL